MPFIVLSLLFLFQGSQPDTSIIETPVKSATVFLSGAEIQRSSSLTLQPGTNHIRFTGLSTSLNEETMQLRSNSDFVLESISKSINENKSGAETDEINQLEERRKILEQSIAQTKASLTVLDQKLNVLLTNQDLSGDNTKLSATELEQAMNYFDDAFEKIETRRIELNNKLQEMNTQLADINNQLNKLQREQRRTSGVIDIVIRSESRRQATLNLGYFVPNARWSPSYDVRVEDIDDPLELSYKANISQNTGVDWNDVQLTVSSAEPRRNATLPSVNPVYLQFFEPRRSSKALAQESQARFDVQNFRSAGEAGISQVSGVVLDAQTGEPLAGANVFAIGTNEGIATDRNGNYSLRLEPGAKALRITFIGFKAKTIPITSSTLNITLQADLQNLDEVVVSGISGVQTQLLQGQTAFSFRIENPYTIKSGNSEKTVAVEAYTLPASYEYFSIPKKQEAAFLTAKVADWETLNLLPGQTNLFLDNSYVGKTSIDLNNVQDTLSFSLGKDDGIVLERKQIEAFREKNFFGSKVTETKGWEITLRNAKSAKISATVIDQIPVSTNEDIDIELKEKSGASFNKSSGRLKWNLALEAGQSQTLRFVYETTYPSGKQLIEGR